MTAAAIAKHSTTPTIPDSPVDSDSLSTPTTA